MLRRAGDPSRRLAGEVDTDRPDDARHWAQVYEELVAFKTELVGLVESKLAVTSEDGRPEVTQDLEILRAELGRLRARRDHWNQRLEELTHDESEGPSA